MRKFIGVLSALILASVAIFDVSKENKETLGIGPVVILLIFGVVMWLLLNKLANYKSHKISALPISLALWSHSLLEGMLVAVSFGFGIRAGLIVSTALLLHLLPECLAIVAALKQSGFSYGYALKTYLITIGLLVAGFVLPQLNRSLLSSLAVLVAGGFIYLAINGLGKSIRTE